MSVSSNIEIFLTIFGWTLYDIIWDAIGEIGLAYLPFVSLFIKNIGGPIQSQEAKDASTTSLRRIEIGIFSMLTVIVLCVQPVMTIKFTGLNYTKACQAGTPKSVTGGKTGTTYDTTFTSATLGGGSPAIPIWWYAVLAVTGGLNDAIITAIPCTTDIRTVQVTIKNERIKNPHLRRQVQQFVNDCYWYADEAFHRKHMKLPKGMDADDTNWIGSEFFVKNVYKDIQAKSEIEGFLYDKDRDLEYDPRVHIPKYGKPTCEQWWTGKGHVKGVGLRDSLKGQIKTGVLTKFKKVVGKVSGKSKAEIENIAIKSLVTREKTTFNGYAGLQDYNDFSLSNTLNSLAGTAGGWLKGATHFPRIYMIKISAPIVQSVVLMLIYTLMPFYFWFSSYDMGKIVFMSIIVFSIKFWTVLWAIAHWLDNNLITALDPGWYELTVNAAFNGALQNNMVVKQVIDFITSSLFVAMPLFWTGLLGWAGYKIGSEISRFSTDLNSPSGDAGAKGGKAGFDSATSIFKKK